MISNQQATERLMDPAYIGSPPSSIYPPTTYSPTHTSYTHTATSTGFSPVISPTASSPIKPSSPTASISPETGADKATQTSMQCNSNDQAVFCTVLCNMLLDRIKDTFQEAMKTYTSDAEREMKMRGLVTEALNSASSDLDRKLSIVSVQSLVQPTAISAAIASPTLPPMEHRSPVKDLSHMSPVKEHSNPPTTSRPTDSLYGNNSNVSDYINRLSFIYGPSRPSMFNPYVKATRHGSDEKENIPEASKKEEKASIDVKMEVETAPKQEVEEDVNIVDDIDDDFEDSENELDKSFDESISGESSHLQMSGSPIIPHTTPITPIPLSLPPLHDKLHASLATNGFVDPSVQYEIQKLLLSAAIAQGTVPTFSPTMLTKDPRGAEVPVMIPSSGSFYEKREYSCQHCDATFSYGSKLRAHMICVHSIKSYQCRQCRKSFLDKEEYIKHLDLHPQRKFQCDKCPSSFDKQHQLSLHYRSHTNEKPYRCQICQRQFAVNDALIRHMRIHTGERPYACQVCGKRFAQKSGLTYHSYLHTGNRPYKCTTCGQGFVHRQALKQHLMKNHLNEQVGRILNSSYSPSEGSPALAWEKDPLVKAAAMKRAFTWESKEQASQSPFKLEGMAS